VYPESPGTPCAPNWLWIGCTRMTRWPVARRCWWGIHDSQPVRPPGTSTSGSPAPRSSSWRTRGSIVSLWGRPARVCARRAIGVFANPPASLEMSGPTNPAQIPRLEGHSSALKPGPLSGPSSILSHVSHASLGSTGWMRLRRMRRFTGNPVCGTTSAMLVPDLSSALASYGRVVPHRPGRRGERYRRRRLRLGAQTSRAALERAAATVLGRTRGGGPCRARSTRSEAERRSRASPRSRPTPTTVHCPCRRGP